MIKIHMMENTSSGLKKCKFLSLKHYYGFKAFIECANVLVHICENAEEDIKKKNKERKILIIFYDMIAYMLSNKIHQQIYNKIIFVVLSQNLIFLHQMLDKILHTVLL